MLIGAHVRGGGTLVDRLERGRELGADAIQVFTQSPRMWKPTQYAPNLLAAYRDAARDHPSVRATYCHATYLINIATDDDDLYGKSVSCLTANLGVARGLGASGLVLHIGSHKGSGLAAALPRIAAALRRALEEADDPRDADAPACPILLENAAGAGGTVGRTFEELEAVIGAAGGDARLGICIDTQHLFASGVDYTTLPAADAVVAEVQARFGITRLGCLHLNDSKVPFGSNRDRHENLGEGAIGATGLAALIGHPALANAPALLEVPGEGDGPRGVDVTAARRVLHEGRSLRGATSARGARPAERTRKTAPKQPARTATTTKATKASAATRPAKAAKRPVKSTRAAKKTAKKTMKKTATKGARKTATKGVKKGAPRGAKKGATKRATKGATKGATKTATKGTKR